MTCLNTGKFYAYGTLRIVSMFALFGIVSSNAAAQALADFALGGHNICAIDTDGRLECTTRFNAETYLPPDDGTLYTEVVSPILVP